MMAHPARARLSDFIRNTPLLPVPELAPGAWLKLENRQLTGSFKVRPVFNLALSRLEEARTKGLLALSEGNLAVAAAYVGERLQLPTTVVMAESAGRHARRKVESLGAKVVVATGNQYERQAYYDTLASDSGALTLSTADSEDAIAGCATLALEILEALPGDFTLIAPVGTGGLLAGVASAIKTERPGCEIVGVLSQSHHWKLRRESTPRGVTIADALLPGFPGKLAPPLARRYSDHLMEATDGEVLQGLRFLSEEIKIIAEPAAAIALVPLLGGRLRARHRTVVCIISGGNVTVSRLNKLLVGPL